ncbi:hypothetical protein OIU79_002837 [Salix purpurea]|uniref:Uncharacterized protein n=1 Tax=Salix purpurea TaxID=77065 RepID=A0A9Q0ZEM9_SALPP|nr:hypothetical protein OIU79_002837 [Salix purpurea]
MPIRMRISLEAEEFTAGKLSEDELGGCDGPLSRAHLPNLNTLSYRIPLMVIKTHRKKMKSKEERMNRCRSGFELLFIVTTPQAPPHFGSFKARYRLSSD